MHATTAVSRVPATSGPTFAARGRWTRQPATSAEYGVAVETFTAPPPDRADDGLDEHPMRPARPARAAATVVHTRRALPHARFITIRRYREPAAFRTPRYSAI
jgi:hypothetical protein